MNGFDGITLIERNSFDEIEKSKLLERYLRFLVKMKRIVHHK
ncbi:hypothetical protein Xbud_01266 [Xenorhabdus budapestensis]|uniref:Uncharacterized protein n=1 Tax=Xenorhabdus budapestensis TaxID=290110 RepID=A0A2D0J2W3_XENBU|nr:hypothetical protein Xbud_01266 [Xenorhabdus budapestensis]